MSQHHTRTPRVDVQRMRQQVAADEKARSLAVIAVCQRAQRMDLSAGFIRRGLTATQAAQEISGAGIALWRMLHEGVRTNASPATGPLSAGASAWQGAHQGARAVLADQGLAGDRPKSGNT